MINLIADNAPKIYAIKVTNKKKKNNMKMYIC